LLGLLPSCGSASTVTLILHGLASPAGPVSITNDLLGDAMLCDRDASALVVRRGRAIAFSFASVGLILEVNGDDGPARGSGDVSRLVYDILHTIAAVREVLGPQICLLRMRFKRCLLTCGSWSDCLPGCRNLSVASSLTVQDNIPVD
jgi:hypothetical protein